MGPLVSVVIPTYNAAHLLKDALDSVLAQTYTNYEIIVVDDGSSDNTVDVVEQYLNKVIYFYQDNQGGSMARQKGFEIARGDYIAALDADDIWLPNKLAAQVEAFVQNPVAGLCYSDGFLWQDSKLRFDLPQLSSLYGKGRNGSQFNYFFKLGAMATSSMMFRRSAIEAVSGYTPNLKWGDFDIAARVCALYPAIFVDNPLMIYRVHEANSSSKITKQNVWQQLDFKRQARVHVLSAVDISEMDWSVRLFRVSPPWIQLSLIMLWRLVLGPSLKHTFRSFTKYALQLIQLINPRSVADEGA